MGRIVPVHEVHDLTVEGATVERELALIKVAGTEVTSGSRHCACADVFRANVVDSTLESFVFQITGAPEKSGRLCRPDAAAGPCRSGPHRRRRDQPWCIITMTRSATVL